MPFCSNVTPQSRLDLKLWSCHTLRKELLGSATIDLLDTLRSHDGKSKKKTHTNTHTQFGVTMHVEHNFAVRVSLPYLTEVCAFFLVVFSWLFDDKKKILFNKFSLYYFE